MTSLTIVEKVPSEDDRRVTDLNTRDEWKALVTNVRTRYGA